MTEVDAVRPIQARKEEVPSDFDDVATTYDVLTGMNPGYHRHLRLSAARLGAPPKGRILDLCCGTGISTDAVRTVYPEAEITGLDASRGMLEVARTKKVLGDIRWVHGNAMDPRAAGIEGEFDAILMAYGIRNVPDADVCVSRLLDLLKPGGTICFHEYSVRDSLRKRLLWDAVSYGIIIPGGYFAGGSTKIYRYLHESVRHFDGVREFENRLRRAGFIDVHTEPMDFWQRGILHSFLGKKP
jgi:ubiquinone/menaquinone biosynthesis C-methylase UbiE